MDIDILGLAQKFEDIENIDKALQKAIEYRENGDFSNAISVYQKLIQLQPKNPVFYDRTAQAQAQQGNFSEAIDNYKKAINLGIENSVWTFKNLGDALRAENRIEEAESTYLEAIKVDSSNPLVYDCLGQVQAQQGNFSEAIDNYRKAISLGIEDHTWTYRNLENALKAENRIEEAESIYQEFLKVQSKQSTSSGDSPSQAASSAHINTKLNDQWLKLHNQGDDCFKQQKWEDAIAFYQQAIELNPDYFWSHYNLGGILLELGRWEEAFVSCKKAIQLNPQFADAYNRLGDILVKQKKWKEAIAAYKHTVDIDPNTPDSLYENLGEALTQIVQSKQKLGSEKDNQGTNILTENDKYKPKLAENKNINPQAANEFYQRAEDSFEHGKFGDAAIFYRLAIKLDSENFRYYHRLGNTLYKQNDWYGASKCYKRAIELNPNYVWTYHHLGLLLEAQQLFDNAYIYHQKALKIKPESERFQERVRNLEEKMGNVGNNTLSSELATFKHVVQYPTITSKPKISIIVPAFNEERFIKDCLNSVLLQSFENWECIVVDDCSSDSCSQIAQDYCDVDSRLILIRHHKNSGLSASRNTAIRQAKGKYLTLLDSDDFLLQDSLSSRISKFEELNQNRNDVVGVFCGASIVPEKLINPFWQDKGKITNKVRDFITCEGEAPFSPNSPILLKSVIDKFGGFDEKMLLGAEDWDMWLRIMRHGYCFEPVNMIGVAYREKQGSMVRSMAGQHLQEAQRLFAEANTALPEDLIFDEQAPYIFWRSRHYYATMLKYTQRAIKFLTMAKLSGDKGAYNKTLSLLPPNSLFYIKRHLNLVTLVNEGIRRFYCIPQNEIAQRLTSFKELKEEIFSDVNIALQQPDPLHSSLPDYVQNNSRPKYASQLWRQRIDIFVIVRNTTEIEAISSVVSQLHKHGFVCVFIDFDAVLGDEGVRDELAKQDLSYISYSVYQLGSFNPQALIVSNLDRNFSTEEKLVMEVAKEAKTKTIGIDFTSPRLSNSNVDLCDIVLRLASKSAQDLDSNLNSFVDAIAQKLRSRESLNEKNLFATQVTVQAPKIEIKSISDLDYIALEEHSPYPVDEEELARFKDIHKGERCFIIGNGPSLNKHNLPLMENDISIGVNGIFYKTRENGFTPTYYVVEDDAVMRENIEEIKKYQGRHKFFPSVYRHLHPKQKNVSFFRRNRGFYEKTSPNYCIPRFSTDITQRLYCGQSVTIINLQIALYMGFSTVYLIGMDFNYVIPPEFKRRGALITSTGDDPNHFHKDYFGVGKTWKDPKLEMVKRNYEMCKMIYEWNDRKIYNATIGGKLEVFERVDYKSLF